MAERRMFSKRIINSARFLKMPVSTQCLYFHLGLHADDDGIVEAYTIINSVNATEDDLKVLVAKNFVTVLNEDLVTYINDWNENNKIRADRKIDSIYKDLLLQINPDVKLIKKRERADSKHKIINGQPIDNQRTTNGQPLDCIGKDRLGKDRIVKDNNIVEQSTTAYTEIIDFLNLKAGTKYKASSKKTQTCIHARLQEGFTVDDFKVVIQKKCDEWIGTEWEKFLRPETLFGTKFEGYLNAKAKGQKKNTVVDESNMDDLDSLF